MPLLKEQPQEIIDDLNQLSDNQRRVLFGDATKFKNWLSKKINDNVSISSIIIL